MVLLHKFEVSNFGPFLEFFFQFSFYAGQCECECTGVSFTNVLEAAFMCADPKSEKKIVKLSVSFGTFGIFGHKS